MKNVQDIRKQLVELYAHGDFVIDKNGGKTIELIGESFIADEDFIFGIPNKKYIEREIEWYKLMSLNVNDIPGKTPEIWKSVASKDGFINSNYGWMIYSSQNYNQYDNSLKELYNNKFSRRSTMIYQRPSMWNDYNKEGMSDFVCTYATQHFIRKNKLIYCVFMRSNDVIFGYRNDHAWHKYVANKLYNDLKKKYDLESFEIRWVSGSLHVYERHFYLLNYFLRTGETNISKSNYTKYLNELKN